MVQHSDCPFPTFLLYLNLWQFLFLYSVFIFRKKSSYTKNKWHFFNILQTSIRQTYMSLKIVIQVWCRIRNVKKEILKFLIYCITPSHLIYFSQSKWILRIFVNTFAGHLCPFDSALSGTELISDVLFILNIILRNIEIAYIFKLLFFYILF